MSWLCIHDIATRQTSELRNDKALQQARTSDTKIHPASEWIQGSERKPRRRGIPAETQEAKLESRKCPWLRQWQSFIALSSNRISKGRPIPAALISQTFSDPRSSASGKTGPLPTRRERSES